MAVTISLSGRKISKKNGHTRPVPPQIDLNQPGRLRVAHVMSLLGIGHSTLYAGMRHGRYPKPDGRDGSIPYWAHGNDSVTPIAQRRLVER